MFELENFSLEHLAAGLCAYLEGGVLKFKEKHILSGPQRLTGHGVICLRHSQTHLERKEVLYLSTGGGFFSL